MLKEVRTRLGALFYFPVIRWIENSIVVFVVQSDRLAYGTN